MDAFLIIKQLEKNKRSVEKMNQSNNKSESNVGLFFFIIIGLYASYLSYECNSKHNVPEIQKIFFAILAYIFGLFYLIYYSLFRYDKCHDI